MQSATKNDQLTIIFPEHVEPIDNKLRVVLHAGNRDTGGGSAQKEVVGTADGEVMTQVHVEKGERVQ